MFTKQAGAAGKVVRESIQRRKDPDSISFSMPLGPSEFEEDLPLRCAWLGLGTPPTAPGPLLLIHLID